MHKQPAEPSSGTGDTSSTRQSLFTVNQFSDAEPAHTRAALRNLIFKARPRHTTKGTIPGNGLVESGAIVRLGRKVLIDREKFLNWVQQRGFKNEVQERSPLPWRRTRGGAS